jgi:CHASE1-domain containing sensor protein
VVFGVFASVLCFFTLRSLEDEKAQDVFRRAAQVRFNDVQQDFDLAVGKVVALGAFCDSSSPITRSSFQTFVTPLLSGRDAGIQALEWAPQVSLAQRSAVERAARQSGLAGFEIRDGLSPDEMVRPPDRPSYFPVLYVQPDAGNEHAAGYDLLFSSASLRRARVYAAATGMLTASARLTHVQGASHEYGTLILRPVYRQQLARTRQAHPDQAAGSDRKQLLGFAIGVLRIGSVVERHGSGSGVDLALMDLSAPPEEQQLYPSEGKQAPPVSPFTQSRTISFAGRSWRLLASPTPGAFPVSNTYSYAGSALCLLFTVMAATVVGYTVDRRRQVELLVEERTGALNVATGSPG